MYSFLYARNLVLPFFTLIPNRKCPVSSYCIWCGKAGITDWMSLKIESVTDEPPLSLQPISHVSFPFSHWFLFFLCSLCFLFSFLFGLLTSVMHFLDGMLKHFFVLFLPLFLRFFLNVFFLYARNFSCPFLFKSSSPKVPSVELWYMMWQSWNYRLNVTEDWKCHWWASTFIATHQPCFSPISFHWFLFFTLQSIFPLLFGLLTCVSLENRFLFSAMHFGWYAEAFLCFISSFVSSFLFKCILSLRSEFFLPFFI